MAQNNFKYNFTDLYRADVVGCSQLIDDEEELREIKHSTAVTPPIPSEIM